MLRPNLVGEATAHLRHALDAMLFDERSFLVFNAVVNGLRVAALLASIPYWRALGFL